MTPPPNVQKKPAGRYRILSAILLTIGVGIILAAIPPPVMFYRPAADKIKANGMLSQIAVAVNAYHTEYGEWPPLLNHRETKRVKDSWYGDLSMGAPARTNQIFFPLTAEAKGPNSGNAVNPRLIVFIVGPNATLSRDGKPRNGFYYVGPKEQSPPPDLECCLYDPWGHEYGIVIDTNGDERLDLSGIYHDFTGEAAPRKKVGVFSMGKDGTLGTNGDRLYRKGTVKSDDVVSWE